MSALSSKTFILDYVTIFNTLDLVFSKTLFKSVVDYQVCELYPRFMNVNQPKLNEHVESS